MTLVLEHAGRARFVSLIAVLLILLPACTESEKQSPEREGRVRIDQETVDSLKNARKNQGASTETQDPLRRTMWLGSLLAYKDGKTVVEKVIKTVDGVDLVDGDVIESINGTDVDTPQEVKSRFGQVEVGDVVQLTLRRYGSPQTVAFARPDSSEVPDLNVTTMQ